MAGGIEPVRGGQGMDYQTKEERIADFLREAIISGRFPRGTRLKQLEIAKLLQTSITPVREALKLLSAEGYVIGDSYRGATVAPFDASASNEMLKLRILLESQLVQSAVERATASDIDDLRQIQHEFHQAAAAQDSEGARAANYRFHRRIHDIAALPMTLNFVQILWARYPFDLINRIGGRPDRAGGEHDELLRAFLEHDAPAAVLVTRRHIESGWRELQKILAPGDREAHSPAKAQAR